MSRGRNKTKEPKAPKAPKQPKKGDQHLCDNCGAARTDPGDMTVCGECDGLFCGECIKDLACIVCLDRIAAELGSGEEPYPFRPPSECRLCGDCEPGPHHWMEDPLPEEVATERFVLPEGYHWLQDEESGGGPVFGEYSCKHCSARATQCLDCNGEGEITKAPLNSAATSRGLAKREMEACDTCEGAGVLMVGPYNMEECRVPLDIDRPRSLAECKGLVEDASPDASIDPKQLEGFAIGDWVHYSPTIGQRPEAKEWRVEAFGKLGDGSVVAWLQGKSGCVSLEALTPATPASKPTTKKRVRGVGATCPRCKSTNTRITCTRTHPDFLRRPVKRYAKCSSCGNHFNPDLRTK